MGRQAFYWACALLSALPVAATAQVTGVVTGTVSNLQFAPGFAPNPSGTYQFLGPQIDISRRDANSFGGASLAATSSILPDHIDFQNGGATLGAYVNVQTTTNVDITFTNDAANAVVPQLLSAITPAGLGIFVGSIGETCRPASVKTCTPTLGRATFADFLPNPTTDSSLISGAGFNFQILSDGLAIYTLSGSLELRHDYQTNTNYFVRNLNDAAAALTGFGKIISDESQWLGFAWDETLLPITFPGSTLLAPGASRTLSYVTTTNIYSGVDCGRTCVVGYSSFGDPVGRGAGITPSLAAVDGFGAASNNAFAFDADAQALQLFPNISFQTFRFNLPTYKNGVLTFLPQAGVPEPATWAMLIAGFGMVGAVARRRRPGSAARGLATSI